jgi:Skp family chaperone for outer membrane proteins
MNLRIPVVAVAFAAVVLAAAPEVAAQPDFTQNPVPTRSRIVFADFGQVFTNYYKTRLANDQLVELADGINRERARMQVEFDALQKQLRELRDQAMAADLSEEDRAKLRREADQRLVDMRRIEERIRQFSEAQEKRWDEQNRRIRSGLIEDVRERIAAFGKARGYLAILDKAQVDDKGVPAVLYQDESVDVTAELIEQVNR